MQRTGCPCSFGTAEGSCPLTIKCEAIPDSYCQRHLWLVKFRRIKSKVNSSLILKSDKLFQFQNSVFPIILQGRESGSCLSSPTNVKSWGYPTSNATSLAHLLYSIHGTTLRTVDEVKYLGVTNTKNLSWKPHVQNICKKSNFIILQTPLLLVPLESTNNLYLNTIIGLIHSKYCIFLHFFSANRILSVSEDDSTPVYVSMRVPTQHVSGTMHHRAHYTRNSYSMHKMWLFTILKPYFHHENVKRLRIHLILTHGYLWLWTFVPSS